MRAARLFTYIKKPGERDGTTFGNHALHRKHIMPVITVPVFTWRKPCYLTEGVRKIVGIGKTQPEGYLGYRFRSLT